MNEYYRSEYEIKDILLHAYQNNRHSHENFEATFRCQGIDYTAPLYARDEEESFNMCMKAALQEDYAFVHHNKPNDLSSKTSPNRTFLERFTEFCQKNDTSVKNFQVV